MAKHKKEKKDKKHTVYAISFGSGRATAAVMKRVYFAETH